MATSGTASGVRSRPIGALLSGVVVGLAALFFLAPIVRDVPPNMDEYIHYHQIACWTFPFARYSEMRGPCDGGRDLVVLGVQLPLRSFLYSGVGASVLYAPVYALLPDPRAVRFLGLVSLGLFTAGLVLLTRVRASWAAALVLLNLPFAFQLIVDTGPVGMHCVLAVWQIVVLRWLLLRPSFSLRALAVACLAGLGLFAGLEQKAIFAVFLPGIVCLAFVLATAERGESASAALSRNAVRYLAPAFAIAGVLAAVLFTAETPDGQPYWEVMRDNGAPIGILDVSRQATHFTEKLAGYLTNLAEFGHRVFAGDGDGDGAAGGTATILYWTLLLVVTPCALLGASGARHTLALFGLCIALAATTLWLVNLQDLSWAGHHVILAWPFLLIGAGFLLRGLEVAGRSRIAISLLVAIALTQLFARDALLARPVHEHTSPDRLPIHAYLESNTRLSEESVIVVLDWGSYYLKELYGPRDQLVVYAEPLAPEQLDRLEQIAAELGRRLVFITRSDTKTDMEQLRARLPGLEKVTVPGARPDAAWQLWAQPSSPPREP